MGSTTAPLLDLGDRAQGFEIDHDLWDRESRVRRVSPPRFAAGDVRAVYPHAPHVVGVLTSAGERLTIRVQR